MSVRKMVKFDHCQVFTDFGTAVVKIDFHTRDSKDLDKVIKELNRAKRELARYYAKKKS